MIGCIKSWWAFWHYYGRTWRNTLRFSLLVNLSDCDFASQILGKNEGPQQPKFPLLHLYECRSRHKYKFCANNQRKTFSAVLNKAILDYLNEKTWENVWLTFVFRVHRLLFYHKNITSLTHTNLKKFTCLIVMRFLCQNKTQEKACPISRGCPRKTWKSNVMCVQCHFYIELIKDTLLRIHTKKSLLLFCSAQQINFSLWVKKKKGGGGIYIKPIFLFKCLS